MTETTRCPTCGCSNYRPPAVDNKPKINFNHKLAIQKVVLDAGHGAINPDTGSDHQALTRKYKFPHNGEVVYEGELNRKYTSELRLQLELAGFEVIETASTYIDKSLGERVRIANMQNPKHTYLLSIHNNASMSHNAKGLEGYTTRGDNRSDDVMQSILESIRQSGLVKLRADEKDGDLDKEYNYYIVRNSKCRSGLLEIGFYDNWSEYVMINDDAFIVAMCKTIVKGLIDFNNSLLV